MTVQPLSLRPAMGKIAAALAAVAPVVAAAAVGNFATLPNITPWYESLAKPPFNPPNAVFGPVWTLLYILMAGAFFRILRSPEGAARRWAIMLFLVQITLNAAWSVAFFGSHSPAAGLVVILLLDTAIAATIHAFLAVDRIAGGALVPYLGWVAFATLLNGSIWWLN
ncbi:TspO/MBR family protein [Pleomorphomonas carboxyditropha]|nr:TspO/MBR family protein [Pleomorphomonas carboxyditropha]